MGWSPRRNALVLCLSLLALLSACAHDSEDKTKDWPAQRFYNEGKQALDKKDWQTAIKRFEALEARYPYGPYAEQAELEVAYAYYKDDDMASAIAAANRFIRLHPTHPSVDYAYYLKGLANFDERHGIVATLTGKNDLSDRDSKGAREALEAFRQLVSRFPNSRYAADASQRTVHLLDVLAQNEIHVAEYYFGRGAYVAAVNRAAYVVQHYQRTRYVEDALGIQAKAYKMMGFTELMNDTVRMLEKNFPNSRYLAEVKTLRAAR